MCAYAPTSAHSDEAYDKFLAHVAKANAWCKQSNPNVAVCMDTNASFGRNPLPGGGGAVLQTRGEFNGARVNSRGRTLLEWLEAERLVAASTRGRRRTWYTLIGGPCG